MSAKKLLILLVLLMPVLGQSAEVTIQRDEDIPYPSFWSPFTNLPEDMKIWGLETFNQENIPTLLGVIGITGVGVMTDFETWQAFDAHYKESTNFRNFSDYGEMFSNGNGEYVLLGGLLAGGLIASNHRAIRTFEQVLEAYVATGIITQVMKFSTGRESPDSSGQRTRTLECFSQSARLFSRCSRSRCYAIWAFVDGVFSVHRHARKLS